ncbi:nicotinate-nicotinamide nucleotide adenylyltransferase [Drancourtella sp. An210]|nr:nicotinate-nicotinamide nucleotide adenylyltransferase [Drancourtella sp. An210]
MKTGIMGGTFNPIHNGHLMLAEHVMEEFGLDEIWFMPNGNPPHKRQESIGTSTSDRLEMVRIAIGDCPKFSIQPYEAEKKTVSYSYQTMEEFRKSYPDRDFYFIIGADSLFQMETWGHPDRLLSCCTVIAAKRDSKETDQDMKKQISYLEGKYHAQILLSRSPVFEVSSSEIREMIQRNHPIEGLVPEGVADYIRENHIYGDGNDESENQQNA